MGADIRCLASLFGGWGNLLPDELAEAKRRGITREDADAWELAQIRREVTFWRASGMNPSRHDVELLMCADSDLTVVNAARVSFDRWHEMFEASDETLIAYLAREGHWSPFAHPQLRFRFRMPIVVAAQWFKHRVGLLSNSISRRYVSTRPEMFVPQTLRCASAEKKQGSGGPVPESLNATMLELYRGVAAHAIYSYETLLAHGVCPEQARFLLPQGVFTEFVQTGNLEAYSRIVRQRTHPHAQAEIRHYALQVASILRERFPVCCRYLIPEKEVA